MLSFPDINPIAFSIGPFNIYWYGLMYIIAFAIAFFLARSKAQKFGSGFSKYEVDDLVTWGMLGAVLGARLGYVIFYDFDSWQADFFELFRVWNGGMSFHGGLLGAICAVWFWSLKRKKNMLYVLDFVAPLAPLGLCMGRIGNFINGELWGKTTDVPWGMVFPNGGALARHPSQLYEAFLEGIVLFIILWYYSAKEHARGAVAGLFAILYASFRIFVEFFREPDAHIGYLLNGYLTMGQILSLPLLLVGICLMLYARSEYLNPSLNKMILKNGEVVWIRNTKKQA